MRCRLLVLSLLASIVVPASRALAASAQRSGSIGIQLVGVAGSTSRDPLARVYIVGRLAPGTSSQRRIEIMNSTDSTAHVSVYPAAAGLRRGSFAFAPGRDRNELSGWTSVSRDVLHIARNSSALETLTIAVPREASAGERYGVVWAEVSAPAAAAGGVTLVNRVGVRIYLTVGPGGTKRSSFAIGPITAERSTTGVPLVVATIHNGGARTLDIRGAMTLSNGPGALRAGPFPVELAAPLTPARSQTVTVQLDKRLPRGPWRARLSLSSGAIHRVAAAMITFPRAVPGATRPPASPAAPLFAIGILAALATLGAVLFARRRRA